MKPVRHCPSSPQILSRVNDALCRIGRFVSLSKKKAGWIAPPGSSKDQGG
jgi:hypothetical protein